MSVSTQGPVTIDAIHAATGRGDYDTAVVLADRAYGQGLKHPSVLNLVAYKLELEGRLAEAVDVLLEANRLDPRDPYILNSLGVCFSKAERARDALEAFDGALLLAPNYANAHNGRGLALATLGERDAARAAQRLAAELDPTLAEPIGALAAMAAEDGDAREGRDLAARALAIDPLQPAAALTMAALDLKDGHNDAVDQRTSALIATGRLTRLHLVSALMYRADARNNLGRYEDAMADYKRGNAELRPVQLEAVAGLELGLDTTRRLVDYFEAADATGWEATPESAPVAGEREHVFLVGFARSGTTLLEQILASHADIVALEEKPTADDAIREFMQENPGLDRLHTLTEAEAKPWRELYWQRVREYGVEPAGKVFVDKLPLHTVYLATVGKLFPRAKILFARRDPRDVVVSCFRKRFNPNPLVVEFTDLTRTAQVYANTMRLAELYQDRLSLPFHIHKHEDLIADLDKETQAICDFIGVPWDANMRNFVETAKARNIRTPSVDQVRRELYTESMEQWRRYGGSIDEIMPIVAPWVERFGYTPT
jgi:tetratricopeptide (TPR) repeat protein